MDQYPRDPAIGWPEVAVLPVTYLCNAHCDMCALGDLNQRERLSDDRLAEIFGHASVADTLRAINFTGGEPTLRKDLPQLVARLVDSCPNLESFSLNSNGMLRPSFERIRGVIDVARSRGKKLYLFISLDGVGRLHDEIRGVRGAFEKTVRTIDAVRALNVPATQLSLGVSATATYKNIDHLGDVLQFAVERDIAVSFTFPMETDVYMNNADRVGRFHADREMVDRFVAFLDTLEPHADRISPPMSFYRSLQATLRGERRTAPCIFQRGGFFLEPTGEVRPCWRSSDLLFGSVAENTFEEVWFGDQRRRIVQTIEEDFCSSCPSPCYVGFPSPLLGPPPVVGSG
ncbi:radical SAM protein [Kutzneria kofuensis]|uniref:MoaA/NifB/PqqE/SkfB family radical SAM enzyme n=1 Tax=Kutzneria kofuensis TaxID=103725 RepID=A0A7W9KTE9_9PSEU|nr:radical SAM protein [Kutzneria kofuensis]MBB5898128.1 MoaA/NifB/PqqE/SkfB family radical SAM enzyme [Kutzneria kofuensis]